MTNYNDNQSLSQRNNQIKKLLLAIANYSPTQEQLQNMNNAKKQMLKNIEKKFKKSDTNQNYTFPLFITDNNQQSDTEEQNQYYNCNNCQEIYNLYTQNKIIQKRKALSQQKINIRIKTPSQNKQIQQKHNYTSYINSIKIQQPENINRLSIKSKKNKEKQNSPSSIHFLPTQKTKNTSTVKKQINLTQPIKRKVVKQDFSNTINIKTKLKIKKPNQNTDNNQENGEYKKDVYLRTQNNINFISSNVFNKNQSIKKNIECNSSEQIGKLNYNYSIKESDQPYQQFQTSNSALNEMLDQNTNFQHPKKLCNVSGLKEKLRQSSQDFKKTFQKGHKRTVTQGDVEIKIKLFNNSIMKSDQKTNKNQQNNIVKDFKKKQNAFSVKQEKQKFTTLNNTKKHENISCSSNNLMNRTLSSMSQQSLRKGLKVCSKSKKQTSVSRQKQKATIKNYTVYIKNEQKCKNSKNLDDKQNRIQLNRTSKINSIMHNLKQGYKVKNKINTNTQFNINLNGNTKTINSKSKSKCGIKTTIII